MQRVAIVGLGLIGSSIGLGLRHWATQGGTREPALEVSGFDISLQIQGVSKKLKAVDRAEWSLPETISRADLVIVATPVGAIREVFEVVAEHGREGLVVTDTGSTKSAVMSWAKEMLPPHMSFVGGHPMAGKTMGVDGAEADLFKGATWCITPGVGATDGAVQTVLGVVTALKAEPLFIDAHEHDGFVAGISHLPLLMSTALMRSVMREPSWRDMKSLSASGFRDVSRLASGDPVMYRDICMTNRENINRWIDTAVEELHELRRLVNDDSADGLQALEQAFEEANDARADWMTAERRDGELIQDTEHELVRQSMADHLQQMFFGSLFRRRPRTGLEDSNGSKQRKSPGGTGSR